MFVRSRVPAPTIIAEVRKEIGALAPGLPLTDIETMLQQLDDAGGVGSLRQSALLAAALGAVGLALALIGLYGVVSYNAAQRTREIGIRIALGAQGSSIRKLVLGQGAMVLFVGLAAGVVLSFAAAPVVRSFLIGVNATDPLTFIEVVFLLAAVTFVACYFPVRRATRVDPILALRHD